MSIRIMTLVFASPTPHSSSQRLMLLALADNANDHGVCWPAVKVLADKCAVTPRNARRSLAQLEEEGLIERGYDQGKRTVYQIKIDALTPDKIDRGDKSNTPDKIDPTPPDKFDRGTPDKIDRHYKEPSGKPSEEPSRASRARAREPADLDAVRDYAKGAKLPDHTEAFFDYFTANGWVQGKGRAPIKDWKAAYRQWCRRQPEFETTHRNGSRPKPALTDADHQASYERTLQILRDRGAL